MLVNKLAQYSFSVQDREAILATPAYAIPKVIQGNGVPNQDAINAIKQHNKDLETYYLSLSDAQFNSALQAALQNIANRSNSGENIVWNKDFVKNIVKPKFPGLYATISSQESKNSKIVSGSITDPDVTFDSLVYDSFGGYVVELFCHVIWTSSGSKITGVSPDTYGECYDVGTVYNGVTDNQQYYVDPPNDTQFYLYKKGSFDIQYNGNPIQYWYPWLTVTLTATSYTGYESGY
jgi:hypothetical protein